MTTEGNLGTGAVRCLAPYALWNPEDDAFTYPEVDGVHPGV